MKTSFCAVLVAGAIVFVSLITYAQVSFGTGTLIILNASKNEIVVAADSRFNLMGRYRDDHCKIDVFGNKLVFAVAGTTDSINPHTGAVLWDAHAIAKEQFDRLSKEGPVDLTGLAHAWQDAVLARIQADMRVDPGGTAPRGPGEEIIGAIFAGFVKNSPMIVRVGAIYRIKNGQHIAEPTSSVDVGEHPPLGYADVAKELFAGQSERAKTWQRSLKARKPKDLNLLEFMTMDALTFSIGHQEPDFTPIGPPIDLVVIKHDGVHWIYRKPNCPCDSAAGAKKGM